MMELNQQSLDEIAALKKKQQFQLNCTYIALSPFTNQKDHARLRYGFIREARHLAYAHGHSRQVVDKRNLPAEYTPPHEQTHLIKFTDEEMEKINGWNEEREKFLGVEQTKIKNSYIDSEEGRRKFMYVVNDATEDLYNKVYELRHEPLVIESLEKWKKDCKLARKEKELGINHDVVVLDYNQNHEEKESPIEPDARRHFVALRAIQLFRLALSISFSKHISNTLTKSLFFFHLSECTEWADRYKISFHDNRLPEEYAPPKIENPNIPKFDALPSALDIARTMYNAGLADIDALRKKQSDEKTINKRRNELTKHLFNALTILYLPDNDRKHLYLIIPQIEEMNSEFNSIHKAFKTKMENLSKQYHDTMTTISLNAHPSIQKKESLVQQATMIYENGRHNLIQKRFNDLVSNFKTYANEFSDIAEEYVKLNFYLDV